MGKKRKYKSKKQLKEDISQDKLLETGLIRKAEWTDVAGKRSWKEGPFKNRAVEVWNGIRTVYKGSYGIPGQTIWRKKK